MIVEELDGERLLTVYNHDYKIPAYVAKGAVKTYLQEKKAEVW